MEEYPLRHAQFGFYLDEPSIDASGGPTSTVTDADVSGLPITTRVGFTPPLVPEGGN